MTCNRARPSLCILILSFGAAGAAVAQTDLFSNQSASPSTPALGAASTTLSGAPAPAGSMWSEAPAIGTAEANAVAGFSTHVTGLTGAYRFADDFTVTDPAGWTINSVSFFAYQTGASPLVSPFSAINVRIWSGRPGDQASSIIFGDTTTNRLISSVSTAVYRVFNTVVAPQPIAPDTTRLIWRSTAALGNLHLPPGTYWLDWQYTTVNPAEEAFSPPATTPGSRNQPGANARQFRIAGSATAGIWANAVDLGKPSLAPDLAQDFPFIINGLAGAPCAADFNADGAVNSQDFFDFLSAFFVLAPQADVNHDTFVNSQDYFDFLSAFFVGC
ncbi:MAG: GC-type dockerin domain-anchored protein [Phycisphaerales bacterium]